MCLLIEEILVRNVYLGDLIVRMYSEGTYTNQDATGQLLDVIFVLNEKPDDSGSKALPPKCGDLSLCPQNACKVGCSQCVPIIPVSLWQLRQQAETVEYWSKGRLTPEEL